jgi:hypothetical protein
MSGVGMSDGNVTAAGVTAKRARLGSMEFADGAITGVASIDGLPYPPSASLPQFLPQYGIMTSTGQSPPNPVLQSTTILAAESVQLRILLFNGLTGFANLAYRFAGSVLSLANGTSITDSAGLYVYPARAVIQRLIGANQVGKVEVTDTVTAMTSLSDSSNYSTVACAPTAIIMKIVQNDSADSSFAVGLDNASMNAPGSSVSCSNGDVTVSGNTLLLTGILNPVELPVNSTCAASPVASDNTAKVATTAFVKTNVATLPTGAAVTTSPITSDNTTKVATTAFVQTNVATLPTGAVVTTTPITSDNTTKVATTAFVKNNLPISGVLTAATSLVIFDNVVPANTYVNTAQNVLYTLYAGSYMMINGFLAYNGKGLVVGANQIRMRYDSTLPQIGPSFKTRAALLFGDIAGLPPSLFPTGGAVIEAVPGTRDFIINFFLATATAGGVFANTPAISNNLPSIASINFHMLVRFT